MKAHKCCCQYVNISVYFNVVFVTLLPLNYVLYCVYYTGESSSEMKIEVDSNDITVHPHDDKSNLYLCTVCEKAFTTKNYLNVHKLKHTVRNFYRCTRCEKHFATQQYLSTHMNIHSSKYKCAECGKCFINNKELTIHRRSHSGEKPFQCTVCSKRFTL